MISSATYSYTANITGFLCLPNTKAGKNKALIEEHKRKQTPKEVESIMEQISSFGERGLSQNTATADAGEVRGVSDREGFREFVLKKIKFQDLKWMLKC